MVWAMGGRRRMYTMADSCWCMAETNTVLLSNYPPMKKRKGGWFSWEAFIQVVTQGSRVLPYCASAFSQVELWNSLVGAFVSGWQMNKEKEESGGLCWAFLRDQAQKWFMLLLFQHHWPEYSSRALTNCSESWDMQPCCMPRRKRKQDLADMQLFLCHR